MESVVVVVSGEDRPDLAALYLGTEGVCGQLLSADLRVAKINETKSRAMPYQGPRRVPETPGETALWQRLVQALR